MSHEVRSARLALVRTALAAGVMLACSAWTQAGTWTAITAGARDATGTMLQLTDGTVMVQGYSPSSHWMKLSPNSAGSYVAGSWSDLASSGKARLYFSSHVLRSGKVWVLGGEYIDNNAVWTNTGETFDPVANVWCPIASHPEAQYGDVPSMLLDGDKILSGSLTTRNSYIYTVPADACSNPGSWAAAGQKVFNDRSDEETWVKLPGGKVLTYDLFQSIATNGSYAETYNPSTNTWSSISPSNGTAAGFIPQLSSQALGFEVGGALRLCDGRVFYIGATGATALYTPSTNTWAQGPSIPGGYLADDAPAAILPNCHVVLAADAGFFTQPTKLFDFDPTANTITQMTLPSGLANQLAQAPAFVTRMLMLPNGQMLLGNGFSQLWAYTPDGPINPALKPVINNIDYNGAGVFTLTGRRITGQSAGSSYGDDVETDQNYPILRLQNGTGVFYARTFNWSSTDVSTGNTLLTTNFTLKAGMTPGNYLATLSAAGLQSSPVVVTITASQINGQ